MVKLWLSSHLYCSNFLFYISSRCRHLSCTFVYTIVILLNSRHVFLQSASILWNAVPFFVYVWCVAVGTDRHYRSSDHISCELKQRHYSSSDHISCELKQRHVTQKKKKSSEGQMYTFTITCQNGRRCDTPSSAHKQTDTNKFHNCVAVFHLLI